MNIDFCYNKVSGIYRISHIRGAYIGSSLDLYTRVRLHMSQLRRGIHHSIFMQRVYNKYGESSFKVEILEIGYNTNLSKLREIELSYINYFKPEFNSTTPVTYQPSNSVKTRISNTLKLKYINGEIVNPRMNKGHRINVFNFEGKLIHENILVKEAVDFLKISNRSVINNILRRKTFILKREFLIFKSSQNFNEYIKYIKFKEGYNIPSYKVYLNGEIEKCTNMSRIRTLPKILNSNDLIYYSKQNKCFYTFFGLINQCRLKKEISEITIAK